MLFLRLSLFYLVFFALLGLVLPYWAPYLSSVGMDATEIGWLLGIFHFSRIYAPNIWGQLADRTGRRVAILRLGAIAGFLVICWLPWLDAFWSLALVVLCFSFFWNAILPQFEVVTLQHLAGKGELYGKIRLWGSVGFILSVLIGAELFVGQGISGLPWGMLSVMLAIAVTTFIVPAPQTSATAAASAPAGQAVAVGAVLKQPVVIQFMVMVFFAQLAHGPYNGFFTLLLQEQGYDATTIGFLWCLGVVAEIVLFAILHKIWTRFSVIHVLMFSMALSVLRWWLLAIYADTLPVLLFAQLLHAASFAVLHATGIRWVQALFPPDAQGRGQALHASFGWGLGGVLGSIAAGYLWYHFGSSVTFGVAALASLAAFLLLIVMNLNGKAQQKLT